MRFFLHSGKKGLMKFFFGISILSVYLYLLNGKICAIMC